MCLSLFSVDSTHVLYHQGTPPHRQTKVGVFADLSHRVHSQPGDHQVVQCWSLVGVIGGNSGGGGVGDDDGDEANDGSEIRLK